MKPMLWATTMVLSLFLGSVASADHHEKKEPMKERMHEWGKACKDDVKKHCKDVQKGEGRIVDCLKAHRDGLAPACKEKMDKL
ncbi:hypothetical protein AZI86_00145 [Bdellovibrio bacteriovorus]|uniref:Cysteine rich repeat-containing protein n=1 Tax=Bdellovibrio bacteriovorus TaxID=959 RepID=A0A150WMV1_BDEBC|nr:cysteine rich repeat-containing protein [Bdellovibrio bacteriovorus]KYG65525.1 hypothetical protein AZI86_00145 [Bdellovibrio bacteriovorus]